MAIDPIIAQKRLQRAYERGRLRHAAVLAAPLLSLSLLAACFGATPITAAVGGAAMLLLAFLFLYRGQSIGRAVFPGAIAGIIPLAFGLGVRAYGHVCLGDRCVSLCIPACATGGVLAGLIIARASSQGGRRWSFLLAANALALVIGALGCSCVGYGGVAGLFVGLVGTLALTAARRRAAHTP